MFKEFPDVVNIKEMCKMLGDIGIKTAYDLINTGAVRAFKIGREYRIPKIYVIDYLFSKEKIFVREQAKAL